MATEHLVKINPEGRVKGHVFGRIIVVEGRMRGNLYADEIVILKRSADVLGKIFADRVSIEEGGRYIIEGIRFSMPGLWVMTFHVNAGGVMDNASFNVMLK